MKISLRLLRNVRILNEIEWPADLLSKFKESVSIKEAFISQEEEQSLLTEVEPHMKRLPYEEEHWDDAIYLYREREQRCWLDSSKEIIERVFASSFPDVNPQNRIPAVHILDLHQDGHIRPHIDSDRYCGNTISGLSLLSDSVMRLRHKDFSDKYVADLLLERRSLYKLCGISRVLFTHEILGKQDSVFDGVVVQRSRRVALICRDLPKVAAPKQIKMQKIA